MGRTICPYCDIEVSESAIEAEDGCCPECGAVLTMSSIWDDDEEGFEDEDLLDEENAEEEEDEDFFDEEEDFEDEEY